MPEHAPPSDVAVVPLADRLFVLARMALRTRPKGQPELSETESIWRLAEIKEFAGRVITERRIGYSPRLTHSIDSTVQQTSPTFETTFRVMDSRRRPNLTMYCSLDYADHHNLSFSLLEATGVDYGQPVKADELVFHEGPADIATPPTTLTRILAPNGQTTQLLGDSLNATTLIHLQGIFLGLPNES